MDKFLSKGGFNPKKSIQDGQAEPVDVKANLMGKHIAPKYVPWVEK